MKRFRKKELKHKARLDLLELVRRNVEVHDLSIFEALGCYEKIYKQKIKKLSCTDQQISNFDFWILTKLFGKSILNRNYRLFVNEGECFRHKWSRKSYLTKLMDKEEIKYLKYKAKSKDNFVWKRTVVKD
jgi:hypothetical protein